MHYLIIYNATTATQIDTKCYVSYFPLNNSEKSKWNSMRDRCALCNGTQTKTQMYVFGMCVCV